MQVGGQGHVLAALLPAQAVRNHFTGDCMGAMVILDPCPEKKISYPCQALNTQQSSM
jgi:hypothetical protein